MKETTKLVLAAIGAGVAANILLSSSVAGATSGFPMVAAGGESLVALGGAYGAWKFKGKKRLAAAIVGGAGAGLLVSSIQGGLLSPPPAKPIGGATAQGTSVVAKPAGAALPTPAVGQGPGTTLLLPDQTTTLPGFTSASGQIPRGAAVPAPNRPPTAAEQQAYADQMALDAQNQAEAMRQMQQQLESGSLPVTNPDESYQSGAATRLGMAPKRGGFGGAGAAFRMRRY